MKFPVIAVTTAIMSLPLLAAPELKGSPDELRQFLHPKQNVMSISAEAEIRAYTDTAIVSVIVTTEQKKLSDAIAENAKLRRTLATEWRAQGIAEKNMKSSEFSSSAQYGWFGDDPKSFNVVNRMAITISNGDDLEKIAKLADQYKEVTIGTTEFEHSKKEDSALAVKKQAMTKILAQKAYYEESLGVTLRAVNVHENWLRTGGSQGAEDIEALMVTRARSEKRDSFSSMELSQKRAPTSFDEVKYATKLTVAFEVSQ